MSNFLISSLSILISVAFYTIMERKLLSYIQIRKGPNKVGFLGILQPFSDAIKLFNKNLISPEMSNFSFFMMSPSLTLLLSILIIPLIPFNSFPMFDNKFNILLLFIISSISVYSILMIGWSSNSKYCFIGSIRSIAQMISYEITFFLIILNISILSSSFSFNKIIISQFEFWFIFGNIILFIMWMSSSIAETNRSPFDFAEGESELVSGFNIEYMGGWFALIFLAEYSNMIILSIISSILFFGGLLFFSFLPLLFIIILFLWVRGTFPRFRYDMLMKLSWKIFLPLSLSILPFPLLFILISL